jgi:hypothetical protein
MSLYEFAVPPNALTVAPSGEQARHFVEHFVVEHGQSVVTLFLGDRGAAVGLRSGHIDAGGCLGTWWTNRRSERPKRPS